MNGKTVPRGPADLEVKFQNKLQQVERSAYAFDAGDEHEAELMAVAIRVLVYDGGGLSLLTQLGLKTQPFLDTAFPPRTNEVFPQSLVTLCLVTPSGARYHAMLDGEGAPERWISFESWWNGVVFVDGAAPGTPFEDRLTFTRQDVITTLANKDGGAHVAPGLDKQYIRLSRQNVLRFSAGFENNVVEMGGIVNATTRQIAHEVLRTLRTGYTKVRDSGSEQGMLIANFGLTVDPWVKRSRDSEA